jgi:hypothetical protein
MGIFRKLYKRRWLPFASGIEITYIRPIMPFEKFRLRSRIATWDDKYWYTEHTFEVGNQVRAIAIGRGVFVKNRELISMDNITALTGENPLSPPSPKTIEQWKSLLSVKKEEYSSNDVKGE